MKVKSSYLLLVDGYPIGGEEPLVVFNVVHPVFQVSIALRQVHLWRKRGW